MSALTALIALAALGAAMRDESCAPAASQASEARAHLAAGRDREAEATAARAADAAPRCVSALLLLAETIDRRLDEAGGLAALDLSRRYRRAIDAALEIEPDNVDARTVEIGYLIHAPGIAGGDRRRAQRRIADLQAIDPLAAAQMQLDLARAEGEDDAIIAALAALTPLAPEDYIRRSELSRRLILAGRYEDADAELSAWPDGDAWREAERDYLRGALRALGGFELDAAETLLDRARSFGPAAGDDRDWPSEAGALALIGTAREARGDRAGALEAYRTALAEDSSNDRARAGLARLDAQ